ncbi:membrane protein, partial [Priestia megaterium]
MKISRFNKDCGNSVDMNIMDGYLFDFPTNVVELQKGAADSFFTDAVTAPEEFKKRILLSTTIEGEEKERYFLVGDIAASQLLANNHINKLHNKITSHIPYITFLAAIAYYPAV